MFTYLDSKVRFKHILINLRNEFNANAVYQFRPS